MKKNSKDNKHLDEYRALAESISALLHPYAEVVIHDLLSGKIAALFNNYSKRKVGDASLLEEELDINTLPNNFGPYTKMNWDGRRLKSVSTTIRDSKGTPIGLFCINFDVSIIEQMISNLNQFANPNNTTPQPTQLFLDDWREKVNLFISQYLSKHKINLKTISREQMKDLISTLKISGAFKAKKSTDYVAHVIGISRATLYAYLKNIGHKNAKKTKKR